MKDKSKHHERAKHHMEQMHKHAEKAKMHMEKMRHEEKHESKKKKPRGRPKLHK
jgi:hypothetical protein